MGGIPHNSESIEAMSMKLRGCIVHPGMFPLRLTTCGDDVT